MLRCGREKAQVRSDRCERCRHRGGLGMGFVWPRMEIRPHRAEEWGNQTAETHTKNDFRGYCVSARVFIREDVLFGGLINQCLCLQLIFIKLWPIGGGHGQLYIPWGHGYAFHPPCLKPRATGSEGHFPGGFVFASHCLLVQLKLPLQSPRPPMRLP